MEDKKFSRSWYRKKAQAFKKESCEKCGAKDFLQIHHHDRDWSNNDPENLKTLCATCHTRLHHEAHDIHKSDAYYKGALCKYCDRPAKKNFMCDMHYLRVRRTGTHELIEKAVDKCSFCEEPARGNGMCNKHRLRMRRHGSPDKLPTRSKPFEKCRICGEDATIKGFCNKHYLRWKRHGDPLGGGPERTRKTKDVGKTEGIRQSCGL